MCDSFCDADFPIEKIEFNINEILDKTYTALINAQTDRLWDELKDFNCYSNTIISIMELNKDDMKKRIYYFGFLQCILEIVKNNARFLTERESDKKDLQKYSYLSKIIIFLYDRKAVTHGELADYLEVKPNALSNTMKRLQDASYCRMEKAGKYKVYSITSRGMRLYQTVMQEKAFEPHSLFDDVYSLLILLRNEYEQPKPSAKRITRKWDPSVLMTAYDKKKVETELQDVLRAAGKKKYNLYIDNNIEPVTRNAYFKLCDYIPVAASDAYDADENRAGLSELVTVGRA